MDLHRRRSVLVRMTAYGRRLGTTRITNNAAELRKAIGAAGAAYTSSTLPTAPVVMARSLRMSRVKATLHVRTSLYPPALFGAAGYSALPGASRAESPSIGSLAVLPQVHRAPVIGARVGGARRLILASRMQPHPPCRQGLAFPSSPARLASGSSERSYAALYGCATFCQS